ncbi:uncharacterized protein N7498_005693 [Penicillium cinerascens]|uniref:Uncharacterized protein n=1 Tax=Penicillium cinerascens TaxID=70096 RepID=A0A9W9T0F1_9EURO|nr:uncharacterized protein N7498_005693 [Penicillium cinerascens]KAJ5204814.1 hypothetical protein N7498_005693 [Penicillium cinerascens]
MVMSGIKDMRACYDGSKPCIHARRIQNSMVYAIIGEPMNQRNGVDFNEDDRFFGSDIEG